MYHVCVCRIIEPRSQRRELYARMLSTFVCLSVCLSPETQLQKSVFLKTKQFRDTNQFLRVTGNLDPQQTLPVP